MAKYAIKNLNPKRDDYIKSNGNFICQPSARAYHTSLPKASHYAKLETAISVATGIMESWDELWDDETAPSVHSSKSFREWNNVKRNTRPKLVIVCVEYMANEILTEDEYKQAKGFRRSTRCRPTGGWR